MLRNIMYLALVIEKVATDISGTGYTTNNIPGYRFLNEGPVGPVLSLNEDRVRPDSPGSNASSYYLYNPGVKSWGNNHSGACWIKITDSTWGSRTTAVSLGGYRDSSGYRGFWFYLSNRGALGFRILYYLSHQEGAWTSESFSTPNNTILDNQWYHVAYTFDNCKISLYINGEKVLTDTFTKPYTPTGSGAYFGCDANTGRTEDTGYTRSGYFRGQVSEWRMYSRTLSDLEIKMLAQGLISHYPLKGEDRVSGTLTDCNWNIKKNNLKGKCTAPLSAESFYGHGFNHVKTNGTGFVDDATDPMFSNFSHDNRTICGWYTIDFTPRDQTLVCVELNAADVYLDIDMDSTGELEATFSSQHVEIPNSATRIGTNSNGDTYKIFNHFAVTCKDSVYKFYINGVLVNTTTSSYVIKGRCFLGVYHNESYIWEGGLSDFRFYATALSDEDIYDLAHPALEFYQDKACSAADFLHGVVAETYAYKRGVARSLHFKEHESADEETLVKSDFTITAKNFIEK